MPLKRARNAEHLNHRIFKSGLRQHRPALWFLIAALLVLINVFVELLLSFAFACHLHLTLFLDFCHFGCYMVSLQVC